MLSNKKHFIIKQFFILLVLVLNISVLGFNFDSDIDTQNEYDVSEVTGGNSEDDSAKEDTQVTDEVTNEDGDDSSDRDSEVVPENSDSNGEEPGSDSNSDDVNAPEVTEGNDDSEGDSDEDLEADSDADSEDGDTESEEADDEVLSAAPSLEASAEGVEYNTLKDVLKADIPSGTVVKTKGYASIGDGGAATYQIVDVREIHELFASKMDNGKYAQLILSEEINVAQVGIFPNKGMADLFNTLLVEAYKTGIITTVKFNSGTYIIDKPILLRSLNYVGTGETVLSVSKSIETKGNRVIYTAPGTFPSYSLTFSNIDFVMETCKDHTMVDAQVILLCLQEIESCKITNCNFKSYRSETNGIFMMTDLVWFKHSKTLKNIEVSNCTFQNLTGVGYEGDAADTLVGGDLWFCGKEKTIDTQISNIKIHDCYFETTVTDEALALWRGIYNDVEISNCSFKNHSHDSHNLFALHNGTFNNTTIKDCTATISAACRHPFKVTRMTGESDVLFDNLDFTIDSGVTDTKDKNSCLFYTGEDSLEIEGTVPGKVLIKNCDATTSNGSVYRAFAALSHTAQKTYEIVNCKMNMTCNYGMVMMSSSDRCNMRVASCTMNNQDYLLRMENTAYCRMMIDNNIIKGKISAIIRPKAAVFYRFSKNLCTGSAYGTSLLCNDLTKTDFVMFYYDGNGFMSDSKVKMFTSNNGIKETDVVRHTDDYNGADFDELVKQAYGEKSEEPAGKSPDDAAGTPEVTPVKDPKCSVPEVAGAEIKKSGEPVSVTVDGVTYSICDDGTAMVLSIGDVEKISLNTVTVDGVEYSVTQISEKACKGNKTLKSVTIGKNVKSIGKNAFKGCKNLKKVTIKANKSLKVKKAAFKGLPDKAKISVKGLKGKSKKKIVEAVKKQTNATVK